MILFARFLDVSQAMYMLSGTEVLCPWKPEPVDVLFHGRSPIGASSNT